MCKGYVQAICSADKRSLPKRSIGRGYLQQGFGLVGDAHAGSDGWQISILLEQLVEPVIKKLGEKPEPGSFAENLLVSGLPERSVLKGAVLKAGEAIIEIAAIGKDDSVKHTYSYRGLSLLAEQGRFGRIIKSGWVKAGDPVEIIKEERDMDSCRDYDAIKDRFKNFLASKEGWEEFPVTIKPLATEQAIGRPENSDYPLLRGKEVLLEATVLNGRGQAFTNSPAIFEGTLKDVMDYSLDNNSRRAVFLATLNAVLNHFGVVKATVHCRNGEPDRCGQEMARMIKQEHGPVAVGIVGYQPGIISGCVKELGKSLVRVTDMDINNLGMSRFGIEIWDGATRTDELIKNSKVLLVTGTTFVNGTAFDLLDKAAGKPVYFYGTTAAGTVSLMGYRRLCLYGKD